MEKPRVLYKSKLIDVSSIYCVGRNYAEHIQELGNKQEENPVIFLKPASALIVGETIDLPSISSNIHYETELVLLVGKQGFEIPKEKAWEHIAGFGIGLDLTARDLQTTLKSKGLPWALAKGFKNSAYVSEFVDIGNKDSVDISMKLNGVVAQSANTKEMIFDVPFLIEFLSKYFHLLEGDIIFTGTPSGVGKLDSGDKVQLNLHNELLISLKVN